MASATGMDQFLPKVSLPERIPAEPDQYPRPESLIGEESKPEFRPETMWLDHIQDSFLGYIWLLLS
jgi:hypothetical protein